MIISEEAHIRRRRGRLAVAVAPGLYLVTMGVPGGVRGERIPYDRHRAEVLTHYDEALTARKAGLIELEVGQ